MDSRERMEAVTSTVESADHGSAQKTCGEGVYQSAERKVLHRDPLDKGWRVLGPHDKKAALN